MKQNDAQRVVQFHVWGYTRNWDVSIKQVQASVEAAEKLVQPLSHYTSSAVEQLEEYVKNIGATSEQIDQVVKCIIADIKNMKRYIPLFHRLWNRF